MWQELSSGPISLSKFVEDMPKYEVHYISLAIQMTFLVEWAFFALDSPLSFSEQQHGISPTNSDDGNIEMVLLLLMKEKCCIIMVIAAAFIKMYAAQSLSMTVNPKNMAWTKVQCSFKQYLLEQQLVTYFPMLGWLKEYQFKKEFPNDFIAGLSVGIMIPQGMSYAKLAGLPVFSPLAYALLQYFWYQLSALHWT